MSSKLKKVAEQALKELGEARKIIRASSSRQLAKDWDRRATAVLADLRTAIQQTAQPVEVTDVMIDAIAAQHTWSVDYPTRFVTDARAVVRAVLALHPVQSTFCEYCGGNDEDPVDHCMDCTRPVQVPMSDEAKQKGASYWAPEYRGAFAAGIAWYEQHQGITAQGKKKTP